MLSTRVPNPTLTPSGTPDLPPGRSLHEAGVAEAQRYKWIESEKAGRDLGEAAIRAWVRLHWGRFARDRWIEHLEGRAFWTELDRGDFGLLRRWFPDSPLFEEIVRRVRDGGENLDILCWAHEIGLSNDEIWRVLRILEVLDINGHRIECQVLSRLSQAW